MVQATIETGIVNGEQYAIGQTVCIVGRGTAAIVHQHGNVERFTRTTMVVKTRGKHPDEWRYRLNTHTNLSIGAGSYGGTYVDGRRCQRPKPKQ